ncbi:MAG TPA: metallophosphoesterase family protein [Rhodopila sp.]
MVPVLEVDGPVLLFGGCYSNLQATQALLGEAARRGIPPDRIICTGDVVAYAADPVATVDLVRASGMHVVMGNCEESLGYGSADCGCGFAAGSACDLLSVAWYAHADASLDDGARGWMRGLPRRIDLVVGGQRLAVVHGSPNSINRFVFASASDDTLRDLIASAGCDGVIGGHCGIPFTRVVDGRMWHNPGAIGVPAHDGTPRVWFSVMAPQGQDISIRHLPLDYDHVAAAAAMRTAGLPPGYADAMGTGLWPSTDVLPAAERANGGVPLAFAPVVWSAPS